VYVISHHTPKVVFSAPFADRSHWTYGYTSAYPVPDTNGTQTNPMDVKLDSINRAWSAPRGNTFSSILFGRGLNWRSDEVTTEGSPRNFMLRTGDEVRATVTVTGQVGTWDGIWTWGPWVGGSHSEVDLFEYHGVHPTELELYNHSNPAGYSTGNFKCWCNRSIIPGKPFILDVRLNATGIQWRVNGKLKFVSNGLSKNWTAYLIVNESIDSGRGTHPAPPPGLRRTKGMTVADLKVLRWPPVPHGADPHP
jgi:hypothetical protein